MANINQEELFGSFLPKVYIEKITISESKIKVRTVVKQSFENAAIFNSLQSIENESKKNLLEYFKVKVYQVTDARITSLIALSKDFLLNWNNGAVGDRVSSDGVALGQDPEQLRIVNFANNYILNRLSKEETRKLQANFKGSDIGFINDLITNKKKLQEKLVSIESLAPENREILDDGTLIINSYKDFEFEPDLLSDGHISYFCCTELSTDFFTDFVIDGQIQNEFKPLIEVKGEIVFNNFETQGTSYAYHDSDSVIWTGDVHYREGKYYTGFWDGKEENIPQVSKELVKRTIKNNVIQDIRKREVIDRQKYNITDYEKYIPKLKKRNSNLDYNFIKIPKNYISNVSVSNDNENCKLNFKLDFAKFIMQQSKYANFFFNSDLNKVINNSINFSKISVFRQRVSKRKILAKEVITAFSKDDNRELLFCFSGVKYNQRGSDRSNQKGSIKIMNEATAIHAQANALVNELQAKDEYQNAGEAERRRLVAEITTLIYTSEAYLNASKKELLLNFVIQDLEVGTKYTDGYYQYSIELQIDDNFYAKLKKYYEDSKKLLVEVENINTQIEQNPRVFNYKQQKYTNEFLLNTNSNIRERITEYIDLIKDMGVVDLSPSEKQEEINNLMNIAGAVNGTPEGFLVFKKIVQELVSNLEIMLDEKKADNLYQTTKYRENKNIMSYVYTFSDPDNVFDTNMNDKVQLDFGVREEMPSSEFLRILSSSVDNYAQDLEMERDIISNDSSSRLAPTNALGVQQAMQMVNNPYTPSMIGLSSEDLSFVSTYDSLSRIFNVSIEPYTILPAPVDPSPPEQDEFRGRETLISPVGEALVNEESALQDSQLNSTPGSPHNPQQNREDPSVGNLLTAAGSYTTPSEAPNNPGRAYSPPRTNGVNLGNPVNTREQSAASATRLVEIVTGYDVNEQGQPMPESPIWQPLDPTRLTSSPNGTNFQARLVTSLGQGQTENQNASNASFSITVNTGTQFAAASSLPGVNTNSSNTEEQAREIQFQQEQFPSFSTQTVEASNRSFAEQVSSTETVSNAQKNLDNTVNATSVLSNATLIGGRR